MNKENSINQAKKILKSHIKFCEALLKHIKDNNEILKGNAMITAWCLHEYMVKNLVKDVQNTVNKLGNNKDE